MPVSLGRHPARGEPENPRGDDEGSTGARERLAKGVDGAPVRIEAPVGIPRKGEVVLERQVDHAVGRRRGRGQDVEVVKAAPGNLGTSSGESSGRSIRPGQGDHLVAVADELGNDGRADPP